MSVRYGVAEGWEVGGRVTLETTGGGYLDSVISWWHTKLSLGNGNREHYPEDEHHARLRVPGGETFLDMGPRTLALGDIRFFAKWLVTSNNDGSSALSLRAATRIPVHNDQTDGERTDLAVMAVGRRPFGEWHVHGMVGGATVRGSPELAPILHSATAFGMLGVEHALSNRLAGIVQYMWSSPLLTGFGEGKIDHWSGNLVLGVVSRIGEPWQWQASLQEDIPAGTPAVDFTLGLALSRRW